MASYRPVIAALRVLDVLGAVNRLDRPTSGQVARAVGINAATAIRMLETLVAGGFVRRDAETGTFTPTGRTLELSRGYRAHLEVGALARPFLEDLQREVAWPSDLAIFDGDAMIVAETSRGRGRLFFDRKPGFRAPVFGTSLGLAFLAFCTEEDRRRAVEEATVQPGSWNDLARDGRALDTLLGDIRARGYSLMTEAYSRQAYGSAVWAFSVPVMVSGVAVAALNLTLLREPMARDEAIDRFLKPVRLAAGRIAAALDRPGVSIPS
ncbi:MAG: helix-turn-helix domain-containing protein [Rhizobiales bacterium]|nr:helix-turn-helix domain-containing protein [Hyphomicrobiales bacterium]